MDNLHPSVDGQNMISATLWNAGFWPNGSSSSTFEIAPPASRLPRESSAYGPVALQAANLDASASPYTTTLKWKKVSLPKGLRLSSAGVLWGLPVPS